MSADLSARYSEVFTALSRAAQYRPPLLLVAAWSVLSVVTLCQVLVDPEPPVTGVSEAAVPLFLLSPIAYAAEYVRGSERAATHQSRILLTTFLFVIIHVGMVFIIHSSVPVNGSGVDELLFPIVTGAATGAGLGSLVGVNYSQIRKTREELETEVERGRRLNQRLTVINRVLRHDVRNKLTLVFGRIDRVIDDLEDPDNVDQLRRTRRALERLHSSTESALQVEHLRERGAETVLSDLEPLLTTVCEGVREDAPAATVDVAVPSQVRVRAHPLLPVALGEILENAVEHNDPENLTVKVAARKDGERAAITVADDGCGIPATEVETLYTDEEKPLQHASGVGLWVVKWVTDASDGDWEIRSTDDGTTVTLRIPREQ